jgi:uncharacterized protein (UPF0261 family)
MPLLPKAERSPRHQEFRFKHKMPRPSIIVLGTCDTKLEELVFLKQRILAHGRCDVELWDAGHKNTHSPEVAVQPKDFLEAYQSKQLGDDVRALERSDYVLYIIEAASNHLKQRMCTSPIHGIIGIGGSSGTSICSTIMRNAIPIGVPKFLVSTMASGDVSPYIDCTDITIMYSVVDIAGLNFLSKDILSNAASAIAGMSKDYQARLEGTKQEADVSRKKRVGLTMFGVTTPACDRIRRALTEEHQCEVIVFHCTGAGGRAMERLVKDNALDAVVDLTTTEIADELVGGVLSAGPNRMEAAARLGIPQVVSVGACDMVNFGPRNAVPKKWEEGRRLYVHNPAVTLMRTTVEENQQIGSFIARKLKDNAARPGAVKVLLPTGGVSMISAEGGVFEDRKADEALFRAVEDGLKDTSIPVMRDSRAINDDGFADLAVETIAGLL